MAKTGLKCSKCSRTFNMPAHLARHMASHKPKVKASAKTGRKVGRPRGATARPVFAASGEGSERILRDMQDYHASLAARRDALDLEIECVSGAMAAFGGGARTSAAPARKLGRPSGVRTMKTGAREGSLQDVIVRVLKQSSIPMSPKQIAAAAKKSGYKTKAADLTKAVSNTLPKVRGLKKQGFGQYRL